MGFETPQFDPQPDQGFDREATPEEVFAAKEQDARNEEMARLTALRDAITDLAYRGVHYPDLEHHLHLVEHALMLGDDLQRATDPQEREDMRRSYENLLARITEEIAPFIDQRASGA